MPAGLRKFLDDKKERIRQVSLPEKPHRFAYTPEAIIFNVDNFNIWFNDPNNQAVYANHGIFLRIDKLGDAIIFDYIYKCYGIEAGGPFLWTKPVNTMVARFYDQVCVDWKKRLAKL